MNKASPVLEEYFSGSRKLYFIFGGIASAIGMPPFEFYNSSRIINENKIFFRDFSQSWYQNGLPDIGNNVFKISEFIKSKINDLSPKEIYFVGNSMGGYASIMFAYLAKKGTAIAFSPQTFISPIKRLRYFDYRWKRQVIITYFKTFLKQHIWDLRKLLINDKNEFRVNIFVSKKDKLDYIHASQLCGLNSINIYEFDVGGHNLVRHLRDEGKLPDILLGKYDQQVE